MKRTIAIGTGLALVGGALACISLGHPLAAAGIAIGAGAGLLGAVGLRMLGRVIAAMSGENARPTSGTVFSIIVFLVKMPAILVLFYVAWTLGRDAGLGFLAAFVGVYAAFVAWSIR